MDNSTRNYHAHGGNEWVIGGKLTFLPGAVVEGAEGLLDLPGAGGDQMLPCIAPCEASTVAQMREWINQQLTMLKDAGVMATETPAE